MVRSDLLAVRRTLHLIRLLQRGPATFEALKRFVESIEGEDAYGPAESTPDAIRECFRKDRKRAWEQAKVRIEYDPSAHTFAITEVAEQGWLDMPDDLLLALVLLRETFHDHAPSNEQVSRLLEHLLTYLPAERRALVERRHPALSLDLRVLDRSAISPIVFDRLQKAIHTRHRLRFHYLSPRQADRALRDHRVEPYTLRFEDGHWYLHAYCLESRGPLGTSYPERHIRFRLSYIQPDGLEPLPDIFPAPRPEPTRTLRYLLHPDLARGDISHHFEATTLHPPRPDGWVEVTARVRVSEEFRAAQLLFRYASKCRVLEPPGVVRFIREWLTEMMQTYEV